MKKHLIIVNESQLLFDYNQRILTIGGKYHCMAGLQFYDFGLNSFSTCTKVAVRSTEWRVDRKKNDD